MSEAATDRRQMRDRLDHLTKAVEAAHASGEIGSAAAVKLSLRIEDMRLSVLDLDARDQPRSLEVEPPKVDTELLEQLRRAQAEDERDSLVAELKVQRREHAETAKELIRAIRQRDELLQAARVLPDQAMLTSPAVVHLRDLVDRIERELAGP